jgi:hypothetical protein
MEERPNAHESHEDQSSVKNVLEHGVNHRRVIFWPQIEVFKIMTETWCRSGHELPSVDAIEFPCDGLRSSANNHLSATREKGRTVEERSMKLVCAACASGEVNPSGEPRPEGPCDSSARPG